MPYRLVPQRAIRLFGRRGTALLLFGSAWILQGIYLFLTRDDYVFDARKAIPHEAIPWPFLGMLWVAFGTVGVWFGVMHRRHELSERDHIGFLAVSAMPLLFTGSYLVSFLTWAFTLGNYGWPFGLVAGFVWGCVSTLIGVVSGWPEPSDPAALPPRYRRPR